MFYRAFGMGHGERQLAAFSESQSFRTTEPQKSEVGGQMTRSKLTSDIRLLTSEIDSFYDFCDFYDLNGLPFTVHHSLFTAYGSPFTV